MESRIFISYGREDLKTAKRLYNDLKGVGLNPWIDDVDLKPGQNWRQTINRAIKESRYLLTLLSSESLSKRGYVQKELKTALAVLEEFPPDDIFVIPVRIDECKPVDEQLEGLHWVDLFPSYNDGLERILRVFQSEGESVTDDYEPRSVYKENGTAHASSVSKKEDYTETTRLDRWIMEGFDRWQDLVKRLPEDVGPRFPSGYFNFAYEIIGEPRKISPSQLPDALRASVIRHTGWPPFWYPTREGIKPYPINGAVECWLGGDPDTSVTHRDAAHSDFWRIHPEGLAFLLRGFEEDGIDAKRIVGDLSHAGRVFDVMLPVWRVGEALLQAQSLSKNLFHASTTIRFVASYEGLSGRVLKSIGRYRYIREGRVAHQNSIKLNTYFDAKDIETNLPEIVHRFLLPLYALFDFFELPLQIVVDELAEMRSGTL
jgi:hypothetical protein